MNQLFIEITQKTIYPFYRDNINFMSELHFKE